MSFRSELPAGRASALGRLGLLLLVLVVLSCGSAQRVDDRMGLRPARRALLVGVEHYRRFTNDLEDLRGSDTIWTGWRGC